MKRIALAAVPLLALAALAGFAWPQGAGAVDPAAEPARITVSGTGSVSSTPDQAEVSAGVESRAVTARAALQANAAEMRKVIEAMERVIAKGDFQAYRRLDADFHMVLIEGAGNPYLVAAYNLISAKIGALRSRAHDDTHVVDRSLETHRRLHRLLEAGEEREFYELLAFHIDNTGRDYRAWLSARPPNAERESDARAEILGG